MFYVHSLQYAVSVICISGGNGVYKILQMHRYAKIYVIILTGRKIHEILTVVIAIYQKIFFQKCFYF